MTSKAVEKALLDCDSNVPARQRRGLGQLLSLLVKIAVPKIVRLMRAPDSGVRIVAIEALGILGSSSREEVGSHLITSLDDSEPVVRTEAIALLHKLRLTPAVKGLLRILKKDKDATVRAAAAEALGDLAVNSVEVRRALLDAALRDADECVRSYAGSSLGLIGDNTLVPILSDAARHERSHRARIGLIGGMYMLGDRVALTELLKLLGGNCPTAIVGAVMSEVDFILDRKSSESLRQDKSVLRTILSAASARTPELVPYAGKLLAQLRRV